MPFQKLIGKATLSPTGVRKKGREELEAAPCGVLTLPMSCLILPGGEDNPSVRDRPLLVKLFEVILFSLPIPYLLHL